MLIIFPSCYNVYQTSIRENLFTFIIPVWYLYFVCLNRSIILFTVKHYEQCLWYVQYTRYVLLFNLYYNTKMPLCYCFHPIERPYQSTLTCMATWSMQDIGATGSSTTLLGGNVLLANANTGRFYCAVSDLNVTFI